MRGIKGFILIFLTILLSVAAGCAKKQKSDEKVVDYFKTIESYKCKATISLTNDRQNIEYLCNVFYDSKEGGRLEIGSDRVYVYKNKMIYVDDKANNRKYSVEEDFDNLYYLSFVNEYIKLIYTNEDTKYYVEEKDGKRYQLIQLTIPDNNKNMDKAVLYVDAEALVPDKIMIYDIKDRERVRIQYSDFTAHETLDKKLFEVQE